MTVINDDFINLKAHIRSTDKILAVTPHGIYSFTNKDHLLRWHEEAASIGLNLEHVLIFERSSSLHQFQTDSGDTLFAEVFDDKRKTLKH